MSNSLQPHGLQPSVCRIFQARILEWGAIACSNKLVQELLKRRGSKNRSNFKIKIGLIQKDPFLSWAHSKLYENFRKLSSRRIYLQVMMCEGIIQMNSFSSSKRWLLFLKKRKKNNLLKKIFLFFLSWPISQK